MPDNAHAAVSPDIEGRRTALAAIAGLAAVPLLKSDPRSTQDYDIRAIRPPGALEEQEFLKRCVKCGQCIRVCPTNVLQPAMLETGAEGLWTPVMNYRVGFCQQTCTACGHVCPTGAIQHLTVPDKLGLGPYAPAGPIVIGTAHVDRGRCLPWSKNGPCMVCGEVCPVSPKAIHAEFQQIPVREGKMQVLAASDNTVTLARHPRPGQRVGEPAEFVFNQFVGDDTASHHIELTGPNGVRQTHPIIANDIDTVMIGRPWRSLPQRGDVAVIKIEYRVPRLDLARCIGCGLCEHECPVVGDHRGVFVTAEGETRPRATQDPHRNRSVRLL